MKNVRLDPLEFSASRLNQRIAWLRRTASREEDRTWRIEAVLRLDADMIERLAERVAELEAELAKRDAA